MEGRREARRLVKKGYKPVWRSEEFKYWIAEEPERKELIKIKVVTSGRERFTGRVS